MGIKAPEERRTASVALPVTDQQPAKYKMQCVVVSAAGETGTGCFRGRFQVLAVLIALAASALGDGYGYGGGYGAGYGGGYGGHEYVSTQLV